MSKVSEKRVIITLSQKGGVGKTIFSANLVALLRSRNICVSAYDGDGAVGGLRRLLGEGDAAVGCEGYNILDPKERRILLDSFESNKGVVLHDLPGGALDALCLAGGDAGKLRSGEGVLAAADDLGMALTIVHFVSSYAETVQSVADALEVLPLDRCSHVAILPELYGLDQEDFPFWYGFKVGDERHGGATRTRFLAGGGVEVIYPYCRNAFLAKMSAVRATYPYGVSSSQAYRDRESNGLKLLSYGETAQVATFATRFAKEIEKQGCLLGLK